MTSRSLWNSLDGLSNEYCSTNEPLHSPLQLARLGLGHRDYDNDINRALFRGKSFKWWPGRSFKCFKWWSGRIINNHETGKSRKATFMEVGSSGKCIPCADLGIGFILIWLLKVMAWPGDLGTIDCLTISLRLIGLLTTVRVLAHYDWRKMPVCHQSTSTKDWYWRLQFRCSAWGKITLWRRCACSIFKGKELAFFSPVDPALKLFHYYWSWTLPGGSGSAYLAA